MIRRRSLTMERTTISELATTEDRFLGGRVTLHQPAAGYRAGLDAVLLAASIEMRNGAVIAEAGCGAGGALICAAARLEQARFVGFDRVAELVAMMERSAVANGFGERVCGEVRDVSELPRELENRFDQSFANPPYFNPADIRPPADERRDAYLADRPLIDWVRFLHHVTRPGGWMTMIHRASELANLLEMLNPRCGAIEVFPVRPHPEAPAKRILVRGRKGLRRGDVKLLAGISLSDRAGGEPSTRAVALMSGEQLNWS